MARQGSAKPCTAVRIRPSPPYRRYGERHYVHLKQPLRAKRFKRLFLNGPWPDLTIDGKLPSKLVTVVLTGTDSLTASIASGVDTESFELPETFVLKAAYPNPFNPATTISYGLPAASEVRITAIGLLGRQVATLVAGDMKAAGYHTVQFNADGLASGTYLIRMEAGDFVATQQVVLLK